MYHLRKLLGEGLVVKVDGGYELSMDGERYIDAASGRSLQVRIQPKIVTLIACHNEAGEWLLYKRKHQPYIGRVGFPYGKIHLGEKVQEAATRELSEKTGLTATLVHRGDAYITTYRNGELLTQMFCHVFAGSNPQGEVKSQSDIGGCYWAKVENAGDPEYFPGFGRIFSLVSDSRVERFFEEVTCFE